MRAFFLIWQSIFLRIYAGLLLICITVAIFAYILIIAINQNRLQSYREDVASGVMQLIANVVAEQKDPYQRSNWVDDAGKLLGTPLRLNDFDKEQFSKLENARLLDGDTVVRYNSKTPSADLYQKVPQQNKIISLYVDDITEQQAVALSIFLLENLNNYETIEEKRARLKEIEPDFGYPLSIVSVDNLELSVEQLNRIRRKEMVIQYYNQSLSSTAEVVLLTPLLRSNEIVKIGPIPLFDWFPIRMIVSITLLSLFLISLGVYALIYPLERKIRLIQKGITDVRTGNLDAKVEVIGEDEISHLAATFNMMTEHIKRLIEAQRELTRAVSHELRTPVARIRFGVEMLADTEDAESRLMQQTYIDDDIESLNNLIDEILTYAKLEEGSPKLEWAQIHLAELVDQVSEETRHLGKSIEIISAPPAEDVTAIADHRYLHRVLQNLAGNAIRYANNKIIISAGVTKTHAYISVEDDGDGIAEENRDKVFVPFARLDDSRTRASGGYGLGLSIVSRIAFWFDGKMSVGESPSLGGAQFTMTWPLKPLSQAIAAGELTQEQTERAFLQDNDTE